MTDLKTRAKAMRATAFCAALLAIASYADAQQAASYQQTNIISDGAVSAAVTDPTFVDPWGISIGTDFWINTNVTGLDYVANSSGDIAFKVTIPTYNGQGTGSPTGTVFTGAAPAGSFVLSDGNPAVFLFCTLDGTISGWDESMISTGNLATVAVDNWGAGAVYTDMALLNNSTGTYILAANFGTGASVEVYDVKFKRAALTGGFMDPNIPAGYAPYAVHTIGSQVFVTYMLRNTTTYQETLGMGNGLVDVFDENGNLVSRAITGGNLNAPWGVALAPSGFGAYGGDLLVGNFGDGIINVYNPTSFAYLGQITNANGNAIANPGLWEIVFGQASPSVGDPNTLYFAAGINNEKDGLFGSISAVATAPAPGNFAISATSSALTVTTGSSATTTISIAPSNGFSGTVSLACTGLPLDATCSFSPASLTVTSAASVTSTVTISATGSTGSTGGSGYTAKSERSPRQGSLGIAMSSLLPLGSLILLGGLKKRSKLLALIPMLLLGIVVSIGASGCGGSSSQASTSSAPSPTPTPVGTSQVTITATSGSIASSTIIALTVQ
jgi:uncharacterized protein (TIGR03118 family)